MATQTLQSTTPQTSAFRSKLDSFFSVVGKSINAYVVRRSRSEQIALLESKSDAELAQMGIRRDRIVHHVFRDLFTV